MWQLLCILMLAFGLLLIIELNPRQRKRAALFKAIAKNDLEAVRQIVDSGLNLNFNHRWQFMSLGSPLSRAVIRPDRSITDFLISRGASLSPKSPGNAALLTNAVCGGNFEFVDLVLASGHNIHFQPPKHSRPLAHVIRRQNIPMARFLVSRGASKEDIRDCRWHAMNTEAISFVRELGVEVPRDVWTAVESGDWDRRTF